MSQESQEWYIAERSRALAMVHLTRRDDLVVLKPVPGIGLESIVCISKEKGEPSVRQFGIIVQGRKNAVTETQLDRMLRPTMQAFVRKGPFPYPVCLFHFSMHEDLAHYTWVAEPAVTTEGPRLQMHEAAHCRKLDRAALDEIVEKVDRWYDDFFRQIAVKAS